MTSQTTNQKDTFDYGNSLRQCKFFPNISSLKAFASMAHLCWASSNYNGWAHFKRMLPGSHTYISLCCATCLLLCCELLEATELQPEPPKAIHQHVANNSIMSGQQHVPDQEEEKCSLHSDANEALTLHGLWHDEHFL